MGGGYVVAAFGRLGLGLGCPVVCLCFVVTFWPSVWSVSVVKIPQRCRRHVANFKLKETTKKHTKKSKKIKNKKNNKHINPAVVEKKSLWKNRQKSAETSRCIIFSTQSGGIFEARVRNPSPQMHFLPLPPSSYHLHALSKVPAFLFFSLFFFAIFPPFFFK